MRGFTNVTFLHSIRSKTCRGAIKIRPVTDEGFKFLGFVTGVKRLVPLGIAEPSSTAPSDTKSTPVGRVSPLVSRYMARFWIMSGLTTRPPLGNLAESLGKFGRGSNIDRYWARASLNS